MTVSVSGWCETKDMVACWSDGDNVMWIPDTWHKDCLGVFRVKIFVKFNQQSFLGWVPLTASLQKSRAVAILLGPGCKKCRMFALKFRTCTKVTFALFASLRNVTNLLAVGTRLTSSTPAPYHSSKQRYLPTSGICKYNKTRLLKHKTLFKLFLSDVGLTKLFRFIPPKKF